MRVEKLSGMLCGTLVALVSLEREPDSSYVLNVSRVQTWTDSYINGATV